MAFGYLICLGDKTTCGGQVLSGDGEFIISGRAQARQGDAVTCGVTGKTYQIVGGIWDFINDGLPVAGSLDSFSSCPCQAGLIPSDFTFAYESTNGAMASAQSESWSSASKGQSDLAPTHHYSSDRPRAAMASTQASRSASPLAGPTLIPAEDNEPTEPGFYIVPKSINRRALEAELFGDAASPEVLRKFNGLNGSLGENVVKAGQLVVLSDPRNYMCTEEEAHLMQAAEEVAEALKELTPEDADFMIKYQGQISTFLADTSLWAGVSAAVMEGYFKDLQQNMEQFQELHKDSYRRDGHLGSKRFIEERRRLISELDAKLLNSRWLRSKTTLGDHPKLKKALKVSTKSLVHHWKKAGGPGPIPGYAKHIQAMSHATKYMKTGGFIAIAIGGAASGPAIYEACTSGSGEECQKAWMVEGGKFSGATALGVGAAKLGGSIGTHVCALLGMHKAGRFLCSAVGVGSGAALGTIQGERTGGYMGEVIYDRYLYD
ncbi:MAG: PAAR domain-containing protein [Pseudomonas sp.]|uniref:PAAR domain-containing protein n=1 Tax=Pseudomonas sp. TaxID=306 RepID=UPI003D0F699E